MVHEVSTERIVPGDIVTLWHDRCAVYSDPNDVPSIHCQLSMKKGQVGLVVVVVRSVINPAGMDYDVAFIVFAGAEMGWIWPGFLRRLP